MRRIAVVGSGIAGLLTAHALRKAGHQITLYSDRSGKQWMDDAQPTGAAARFHPSLELDRELDLAFWDKHPANVLGVSLVISLKPNNRMITCIGRTQHEAYAVDVRLLSDRYMAKLEERGGKVVVGPVGVAQLDKIAGENDLTIVGVGKGELGHIFERNAERSVYTKPKRNLAMVVIRGQPPQRPGFPFTHVSFNVAGLEGETFWAPFVHKDMSSTWVAVFEAQPGGKMDQFQGCKTGEEALATAKKVIRELVPWEAAWWEPVTLADPNGWLVGAITPTVRNPVAKLPSGRIVTGVGDTLMHLDPITGQGANNGTKMARALISAVAERGDGPFDAQWMTDWFEKFWESDAKYTAEFTNMFLEPMGTPGRLLMFAQLGSDGVSTNSKQRLANAIAETFEEPRRWTPSFRTTAGARQMCSAAGGNLSLGILRGLAGVAKGQIRQALGMSPGLPGQM